MAKYKMMKVSEDGAATIGSQDTRRETLIELYAMSALVFEKRLAGKFEGMNIDSTSGQEVLNIVWEIYHESFKHIRDTIDSVE